MAEEIFHYVLAFMDRFHILQREQDPTAQHTRPHRGNGLVQHIQQARPLLIHRADQLQAAHRKLIEAHITVFFDTGKRGDMRDVGMLRLIQIIQDGPRSYDSQFQVLDTETFQVLRFEMFQQAVVGCFQSKHPVVQFENKEPGTESFFKTFAATSLDQDLFRGKIVQQFIHIVDSPLSRQELAGRDIEKCDSTDILTEMDGGKEVVFFMIEDIVIDRDAGSNQFGNAAFHQFFRELRIFQLVADGYALTGTYQFRQITVQCMMRETGHLDRLPRPVRLFRLYDTQYLRSGHSVFTIHFVKVAYTE